MKDIFLGIGSWIMLIGLGYLALLLALAIFSGLGVVAGELLEVLR